MATQKQQSFSLHIIPTFKFLEYPFLYYLIQHIHFQMSKSCNESFQCAAKAIRESDKEPNLQKVTKEEKMRLYALYKQATQGDCTTCKPENVQSDEKQKCEAWCKMKGRSKEDAQKEYVQLSRSLLKKYGASKLIDF